MPFYRSLKFTTMASLALLMMLVVGISYLIEVRQSKKLIDTVAVQKVQELARKIEYDIHTVSRLSGDPVEIEAILAHYLSLDVCTIATLDATQKPLFTCTVSVDRNDFIVQHEQAVRETGTQALKLDMQNKKAHLLSRMVIPHTTPVAFGVLYVEYDLGRDLFVMQQTIKKHLYLNIFWSVLILAVLYFFLNFYFLSPIKKLSSATQQITQGIYLDRPLEISGRLKDEIYILFRHFNAMADHIKRDHVHLNNLNRSLMNETQKAQKANQSKSEFLANMSHEVRTPLNAILGFIGILLRDETDEVKSHYLTVIDNSSHLLLNVINDILDLSKIESGKLEINIETYAPYQELLSIIELYKAKALDKEITFVDHMNHLPNRIQTDMLRIKQIIGNLLSNALKFTEHHGRVEIDISYMYENQTLKVVVKDTGIGIDPKKLQSIFDPFAQSDKTIAQKYGGTGLGLSISKKLIEMLGGTIDAQSTPQVGSVFTCEIPAPIVEDDHAQVHDTQEVVFNGEAVLVAEDNKTNRLLIGVLLDELGFNYTFANDGLEAVEAFKKASFALILMDENMPNMTGSQATQAIRVLERELERTPTPIVALTANALKGDKERFIQAGMDEYVPKPIDRDKLVSVIVQFIPPKTH